MNSKYWKIHQNNECGCDEPKIGDLLITQNDVEWSLDFEEPLNGDRLIFLKRRNYTYLGVNVDNDYQKFKARRTDFTIAR